MTWVRIDDHFDEHPKLAQVGPVGWGIWLAGLAYSNRNLTDGFIPRSVARSLGDFELVGKDGQVYRIGVTCGMAGTDLDAAWVIDFLVDAHLWDEVPGGYRIHDYDSYQPTKDKVLSERALKNGRQQRWREQKRGGSVDGGVDSDGGQSEQRQGHETPANGHVDLDVDASTHGDVDACVDGGETPAPVPVPKPLNSKVNTNAELRSAVAECFAYWQDRCGHPRAQLSDDRRGKLERRLRDRRKHHDGDLSAAIMDVRLGIEGAAAAPFIDEQGKRFDDIELICRTGSKLEDFMGRTEVQSGNVVALGRPKALRQADRWLDAPEYQGGSS